MSRLDDPDLLGRLITAAHDLLATARELEATAKLEDAANASRDGARDEGRSWLGVARRIYRDRRRRDELFRGTHLFGEPAWDILLDLFIAIVENKRISITSACIGAAAPSTTALRWLNILEREGLIEREGDSNDLRRSYVRLSESGYERMIAFFNGRPPSGPFSDSRPNRPGRAPIQHATAARWTGEAPAEVTAPEP